MIKYSQFDIWLVSLNPTIGSEINKTIPCVIISPDEINNLRTIIVSPLTTKGFKTPTRIDFIFNELKNLIILDQIRTVDKKRLIKKIGFLNAPTKNKVSSTLVEMFSI